MASAGALKSSQLSGRNQKGKRQLQTVSRSIYSTCCIPREIHFMRAQVTPTLPTVARTQFRLLARILSPTTVPKGKPPRPRRLLTSGKSQPPAFTLRSVSPARGSRRGAPTAKCTFRHIQFLPTFCGITERFIIITLRRVPSSTLPSPAQCFPVPEGRSAGSC